MTVEVQLFPGSLVPHLFGGAVIAYGLGFMHRAPTWRFYVVALAACAWEVLQWAATDGRLPELAFLASPSKYREVLSDILFTTTGGMVGIMLTPPKKRKRKKRKKKRK